MVLTRFNKEEQLTIAMMTLSLKRSMKWMMKFFQLHQI